MNENDIFRGSGYYYEKVEQIKLGDNKIDFLGLGLPPFCNYDCNLCFSSMKNSPNQDVTTRLNIDEYKNIITELHNRGLRHIEISGEGEPLLFLKELKEIISYSTSLGIHILIHTNGSLLNNDLVSFFSDHNVSIMVSVSYFNDEKYSKFVGKNDVFFKVLNNIKLLSKNFKNKILIKNNYQVYRLGINAEFFGDNTYDIALLNKMCEEYNLFLNVSSVIGRPDITSDLIMDYDKNSIIVCDSCLNKTSTKRCALFYYGIGIKSDGEVLFEAHSYDTSKIIGNIRNNDIDVILSRVKKLHDFYFEKYDDKGFCPLRNKKYSQFCNEIKMVKLW